jgi:hypothetical protein
MHTMQKSDRAMTTRLSITMDDRLYRRLERELPSKELSAFIEEAVRRRLLPARAELDAAYAEAAKERWRREVAGGWASTETGDWPPWRSRGGP